MRFFTALLDDNLKQKAAFDDVKSGFQGKVRWKL